MALVTVGVTCRPPFPSSCWPAPPSASMMASLSRTGRQPVSPPPLGGAFLNDVRGERVLLCITRRSSGSGTRPDSLPVLFFSRGGDSLSVRPACLIEHVWQLLPHPYRRSSLSCRVDGKWVANPARTSLLDLGYSGGDTFDVQFSSSQGCRGGADAALPDPALARGTDAALNEPPPLARRASIPRACNAAPAPVATPVVAQPFLPATPPGGGGATTQAEEAPALC